MTKESQEPRAQETKSKEERYAHVVFMPRGSPNDPEQVELGVNGEQIVCRRSEVVCLPERYVEVARNAYHMKYEQKPGLGRKEIGTVHLYPHEVRDWNGTREEFMKTKKTGTDQILAALKMDGDQKVEA
jgi:hypothetical protein